MDNSVLTILFTLFILGMLALDLGVFHRRARAVSFGEGAIWSAVWLALALAFNAFLYFWQGPQPALEFLGGCLLERSLSMDNVFRFAGVARFVPA